jgi:hypothetical protein
MFAYIGTQEVVTIGFFIVGIWIAYTTANMAEKKGHSGLLWAVIGTFLGIFGLIFASMLPDKRAQIALEGTKSLQERELELKRQQLEIERERLDLDRRRLENEKRQIHLDK